LYIPELAHLLLEYQADHNFREAYHQSSYLLVALANGYDELQANDET